MNNDEIRNLLPFYVMETLTDAEIAAVDAALAVDDDLRAELQALQMVTDTLAIEPEPMLPPPNIRATLLERVQADAAGFAATTPVMDAMPERVQPALLKPQEDGLRGWLGRVRERWATPMMAASLALAAVALIWAFTLQGRLQTLNSELTAANYELSALSDNLSTANDAIATMSEGVTVLQNEVDLLNAANETLKQQLEEQSTTLAFYHNPAVRHVTVAGTDLQTEAAGQFSFDAEAMQATLVVNGLVSLDASQTYQLWYINADGAFSGGVFDVSVDGTAIVSFDSAEIPPIDAIGISIEPAGGSESPSDQIVMLGSL